MAKHTALASAARTHERSGRALPLQSKLIGNLAGAVIVLACIALPLVLGQLSVSIEDDAGKGYIRSLYAERGTSPLATNIGMGVAQLDAGTRLFGQHYYFVNGCIASPGSCIGSDAGDWGEYYDELRRLYNEAVQSAGCTQCDTSEKWVAAHAHFIMSRLAPTGAADLARALAENKERGDIHIVGTSAGGSAVISYLSQAMRGEVPMDNRIRSVLIVDAPLGYRIRLKAGEIVTGLLSGFQASAMKTDVQSGLGQWVKLDDIAILTVDTEQDTVSSDPIPEITNDPSPKYYQSDAPLMPAFQNCASLPCEFERLGEFLDVGSAWHMYTGSHMSDSAQRFIDEHWR